MDRKVTVGFAGLSHLGLVSSIATASKGFRVIGFDTNAALVADLKKSKLPVHEPLLDDLLAKSPAYISFTSSVSELLNCDVVYISCDIKTTADNKSDLTGIRELIATVAPSLKQGATLVVLSQVPPGFTRQLSFSGINVVYQVETLVFGRAVERALYPERYIIGWRDPKSPLPEALQKLLSAFDCPILPMKYESAELAKISINMFLVSSVSTTNTLAEICERIGADWNEIAPSLRLDKRIGLHAYLSPGLGIAGGNLERDLIAVQTMAKEHGTDAGIVDAWLANSQYRKDWALRELQRRVALTKAQTPIAVWGIAYKQDTKSIKNSPAVALIESLAPVKLQAYDPQAVLKEQYSGMLSENFSQVKRALDACDGADALVVMTPWKEFSEVDLAAAKKRMKGNVILDPYGVLNADRCRALGFSYFKLGVA